MSTLRETYSQDGFIPLSEIEPGRNYIAFDKTHDDPNFPGTEEYSEEVRVDRISRDEAGYYKIDVTYIEDEDEGDDQWYLAPTDRVFKEVEVPVVESKGVKILGIKRKSLNESQEFKVKMREEPKIQLGDDVIYDKKKGNVIGAIGDQWIIQCQYETFTVDTKDLTSLRKSREVYGLDQFKFDDKTQALLFEQMVRCGIYVGSTPIKTLGCNVKYSEWNKARNDEKIRVLVEGNTQFFPKEQIRIQEDINNFANPDNYVEGVIVDEATDEALESVMINVEDYTSGVGDADMVRILKKTNGEPEMATIPKALLKTLSV